MPDTLFIVKGTGVERWSDAHAIGTMVLAGVDPVVAVKAVESARSLFQEFGVAGIPSHKWTLLSEELRRGRLGAATKIVTSLPKTIAGPRPTEIPISRDDDDGDHPRDIPPPKVYGEEIEVDLNTPPVYIVSDFHLGSNRMFPGSDKRKSNDMDQKTLRTFVQWLSSVDKDAAAYDYYVVVMNGDFLDLWQAKRPSDDSNASRLKDILKSNSYFFEQLGTYLRSHS